MSTLDGSTPTLIVAPAMRKNPIRRSVSLPFARASFARAIHHHLSVSFDRPRGAARDDALRRLPRARPARRP